MDNRKPTLLLLALAACHPTPSAAPTTEPEVYAGPAQPAPAPAATPEPDAAPEPTPSEAPSCASLPPRACWEQPERCWLFPKSVTVEGSFSGAPVEHMFSVDASDAEQARANGIRRSIGACLAGKLQSAELELYPPVSFTAKVSVRLRTESGTGTLEKTKTTETDFPLPAALAECIDQTRIDVAGARGNDPKSAPPKTTAHEGELTLQVPASSCLDRPASRPPREP